MAESEIERLEDEYARAIAAHYTFEEKGAEEKIKLAYLQLMGAKARMLKVPPVYPRRLFLDTEPDGYLESDQDYIENNMEAVLWFLENAELIGFLIQTNAV